MKSPALPSILILAAGASSRMRGADKLLEQIDGVAQLRRVAQAALATGCDVHVALPPDRPLRAAALAGLALETVTVADAAEGMAASIRRGLASVPPGPVMLLLADLPEISEADLGAVLAAQQQAPERIIRATSASGRPGHPVIFPPWARAELAELRGDAGAFSVLKRHADVVQLVPLPDRHAITDLDTPEDWAAWRATHNPG